MPETTFEIYGESGGYDGLSFEEALALLIQLRQQYLDAGEETDLAIQEIRWDDQGMPVAHRVLVIEPDWIHEPGAVLAALRDQEFSWSEWEPL